MKIEALNAQVEAVDAVVAEEVAEALRKERDEIAALLETCAKAYLNGSAMMLCHAGIPGMTDSLAVAKSLQEIAALVRARGEQEPSDG